MMEQQNVKLKEAEPLFKYLFSRLNKRLGTIILVSGESGKGKSYSGLRILEIWYWLLFKKPFPTNHICRTLEEAMILIKDFKDEGEGILIEELSVLVGKRDAGTKQNKLWNKFIDIVRIKKTVIIGNAPHINFVDSHFLLMSHVWIECLGVNFRKNLVICKPLMLQMSQNKTEPYKHKFVGDDHFAIDYFAFRKPSKYITTVYDRLKDDGTNSTIQDLVEFMVKDKMEKEGKPKGKKKPMLSPREEEALELKRQGKTSKEATVIMGLSAPRVYWQFINKANKKGFDV